MAIETKENLTFDPVIHSQMRREEKSIVTNANIPLRMLWATMIGVCSDIEIDYVKNIRRNTEEGIAGLVYVGKPKYEVTSRFQLVAGTLLRNFVNAKVMTLHDVLGAMREGVMPRPSVLLIPNFYDASTSVMEWQGSLLLDALMSRRLSEHQTILYVSDLDNLGKIYGDIFEKFIRDNYSICPC